MSAHDKLCDRSGHSKRRAEKLAPKPVKKQEPVAKKAPAKKLIKKENK